MTKEPHSEQYERARGAFDQLGIEDRAIFLVEAVVTTMAEGVGKAGRVLADEMDALFQKCRAQTEKADTSSTAEGNAAGDDLSDFNAEG